MPTRMLSTSRSMVCPWPMQATSNGTPMWAMEDPRRDYGERRMIGYALMGERLYCVVFTERRDAYRIISLRKANNREITCYVKAFDAM